MIITKHEAATGRTERVSAHVTFGRRKGGKPPGTGPIVEKPYSWNLNQALAMIVPTTTTSATGNFGTNRLPSKMAAVTNNESATVDASTEGNPRTISQKLREGSLRAHSNP